MIDRYLTETPWIALAIWVVLYVSDYYLTIWGATLRTEKAAALIDEGGSYELTPAFRADVDALRLVSPTFLWYLLLSMLVLLFAKWRYTSGTCATSSSFVPCGLPARPKGTSGTVGG